MQHYGKEKEKVRLTPYIKDKIDTGNFQRTEGREIFEEKNLVKEEDNTKEYKGKIKLQHTFKS